MLSFAAKVIILLIIIGGITAYIGDYIGRSIGRRRLTFLRLRPRYTALAFTVITGMLISLMTLAILLVVSQDARTALFGMEELQNNLTDKVETLKKTEKELLALTSEKEQISGNLNKSKKEIVSLEKTKGKLKEEIEASRMGDLLFKVDDILLTSVIQAGPEKNKLEAGLKQILSAADNYVRSLGSDTKEYLIFISPADFDSAINTLQKRSGQNIIKVIATRNTLFGEEVPVRFEISDNVLIYKKDEKINQIKIPANQTQPKIEEKIKSLLDTSHRKARLAGVVADPKGQVGSVPYTKIVDLAKKIERNKRATIVVALAENDIYSIGPMKIKFKVLYQ